MEQGRGILKEDYIQTVSELAGSINAGAESLSNDRQLPHLSNTRVVIEARVTFGGGATGNARIRAIQSMDAVLYDTDAPNALTGIIPAAPGQTVQMSFVFDVPGHYYQIGVANLDASAALTVVHVKAMEYPYFDYLPA